MTFNYFSKNGKILPINEAIIPISSIEYSYGFGVYENIRISSGRPMFMDDHIDRLIESAKTIELEHTFSKQDIARHINELIAKNGVETCNIKMLLIGASTNDEAQLYIMCLNPFFPDRKLYRDGVALTTYNYERAFPQAKTLNMLQSYIAYQKAKKSGAYDALLINRKGYITEGTRTNFFAIKEKTIYSPLENEILLGVTRKKLLEVANNNGYEVIEQNIKVDDLPNYDGVFISSTSSKILPIKMVDQIVLNAKPKALDDLMILFDKFLDKIA